MKKSSYLTIGSNSSKYLTRSDLLVHRNPDGVMLCVLPENAVDDVTLHIHFTLIEAYCWENDIRVIKVRTKYFLTRAINLAKAVSPVGMCAFDFVLYCIT